MNEITFDFRLNQVLSKIPRCVPRHSSGGSGARGRAGSGRRAGSWWDGGGQFHPRFIHVLVVILK